jgi:uncharacterized protein
MKSRRLHTLDRFLALPGDEASAEDNLRPLAEIVGGEIISAEGCRVMKVVDEFDLFPYSTIKDIHEHRRSDLYRRWHFVAGGDEHHYDPDRFLFLDTETTGLSGGTGMVVFLCGFGFFDGDRFRVVQYFLPDYPDEPLLLHLVAGHITPETIIVSYNGKSFDWPMLSQRWTINRMGIPVPADHLDTLHPARSLFRRLGEDCSLTTLEKTVLAFDRGEDVPGYLIPSKYFDYLYDRQPGMIPEIIRHNRLDIISLALVTRYIPEYLSRPETITSTPLLEGVIHHFYRNRRFEAMTAFIDKVTPGHFEAGSPLAKLEYSLALKSLGRFEEAGRVWKAVAGNESGPHILRHLLELAKHQEHREKDPESALETVEVLLGLETRPHPHRELLRRQGRLADKCRRLPSKPL